MAIFRGGWRLVALPATMPHGHPIMRCSVLGAGITIAARLATLNDPTLVKKSQRICAAPHSKDKSDIYPDADIVLSCLIFLFHQLLYQDGITVDMPLGGKCQ